MFEAMKMKMPRIRSRAELSTVRAAASTVETYLCGTFCTPQGLPSRQTYGLLLAQ